VTTAPPERIELQAADGARLVYELVPRAGTDVLVIVPGFWRSRLSKRTRELRDALAPLCAVAVVDPRGHGESGGTNTFGDKEPHDLGLVLAQLAARGYTRAGLIGLSMGGYISMETARSHLPRPLAIAGASLISSPTAVSRARPHFYHPTVWRQLDPDEAMTAPRFNPLHVLRRWPNAAALRPAHETFPVGLFHNLDDWLIPHDEMVRWKDGLGARCTTRLLAHPGRLHADAMMRHGELIQELQDWWGRCLRG
jgi:pimeloyl-ACP methyl ester carboxylesterase